MDVAFLRPTKKQFIIDVIAQAGIDVSSWSFKRGGKIPVKYPKSNGGFCYEWSFRGPNNAILVLCIWHEELKSNSDDEIFFAGNLKKFADDLTRALEKLPENQKKTITDPRIKRADHFTQTVSFAFTDKTPVHVVIVNGPVRGPEDESKGFDRAIGRQLDSELWRVTSFDENSGAFVLVRGGGDQVYDRHELSRDEGGVEKPDAAFISETDVADQFATGKRPDTYIYNGVQRYRDPNVRRLVLNRSEGVCELTGVPGFLMANGRRYLETHHIIPLSEGGADAVENVIALSADAHRQAHFGVNRDELRERCLEIVACRMAR